ncbi:MAG: hypothetical protein EA390_14030 [Balneolaceae bacterium]|nr:MAG: hypothetical protein EA390_14030 [Balneolaceae bacterium]
MSIKLYSDIILCLFVLMACLDYYRTYNRQIVCRYIDVISRFLNALYAVVLGIVLVQVFYFFTGSGSVVVLYDNILFLAFLGVCSILGWIVGDSFIVWLKDEIGNWKFW